MAPETEPSSSAQKPSALLGLLGILACAFGALIFSKVGAPNDDSFRTVHPQDTPEYKDDSGDTTPRRILVVQPPVNAPQSRERRKRKTPWWEIAGFILGIFLLAANWFQGWQTKKAANTASLQLGMSRQAMQIDQRPWLKMGLAGEPSDIPGRVNIHITISINQPVSTPIRVTNIGKTTAQKIIGYAFIEVVELGKEPNIPDHPLTIPMPGQTAVTPLTRLNKRPYAVTGVATSLIYPGDSFDSNVQRLRMDNRQIVIHPLSQGEFNALRQGKSYLAVYGRLIYYDVFGTDHWVQFCQSIRADMTEMLPSESVACANYGGVDNNTQ